MGLMAENEPEWEDGEVNLVGDGAGEVAAATKLVDTGDGRILGELCR